MHKLTSLFSLGRLALVLLILTLFAGCSDDKSGSSTDPGTIERLFSYPVIQGCGTCHDGEQSTMDAYQGTLVFDISTPETFKSHLTTKKATQSSECSGLYVNKNKPEDSIILYVLDPNYSANNSVNCNNVNFHSTVNVDIPPELMDDLLLWIKNGAQ